MGLGSNRRC